ncbi:MAG: hypothetical protein IPO71_13655 [Nitrosomonas sp.]|nr:hypothetical protein [Nitrosomonas sp.]
MDAEGKAVQFEDGGQPGISCTKEQSADPDATWLKKGKKSQFGYRSYLVMDAPRRLCAQDSHRSCQPERNDTFPKQLSMSRISRRIRCMPTRDPPATPIGDF